MGGESRKWLILVATIWIQAFTGTNFDFSAYSSHMKHVLGISQMQLNYLATASDLGKSLGWTSGVVLMYFPVPAVMFFAAVMGFIGYGFQWLIMHRLISLPYLAVFLLCLLAGLSITWFNTVCFVLCIKNFPSNRPLALSLSISFNGVSAALYNLAANAIDPSSTALFLLLNATIPLITSMAALAPILLQPPLLPQTSDGIKRDQIIFVVLNFLAVITGIYLLFVHSSDKITSRFLLAGAIFLLVLPLGIPGITYARKWFRDHIYSSFELHKHSGFILVDAEDLELHRELLSRESSRANGISFENEPDDRNGEEIGKDRFLFVLGEEHNVEKLLKRLDFWLYYLAYFCGGTIGLVYSNNLGQIAQSLGHSSMTPKLITFYSSFSFFGRLLSAAPDFIRQKLYFARTGWLSIALLPTPIAFFLLAVSGDYKAVEAATAMIGLSSGFIFSAAVSVTSELFGPNSVGVNHNILITNIPVGSLLYGLLAAIVYDSNGHSNTMTDMAESIVCMGRKCYFSTFILWGCFSVFGLICSLILFLRTRHSYCRFEKSRQAMMLD